MSEEKKYQKSLKSLKNVKKSGTTSRSLLDDFDAPLPASCVDLRPFRQVDQDSQFIICEDESDQEKMNQLHFNEQFDRDIHSLEKIMDACNFDRQVQIDQEKNQNFEQSPQSSSKYSSVIENIQVSSSWKRQTPVIVSQKIINEQSSPSKIRITNDHKRVQFVKQNFSQTTSRVNDDFSKMNLTQFQSKKLQPLNLRSNIILLNQQQNKIESSFAHNNSQSSKLLKREPKKIKTLFSKMQEEQFIESSHDQYNPQKNMKSLKTSHKQLKQQDISNQKWHISLARVAKQNSISLREKQDSFKNIQVKIQQEFQQKKTNSGKYKNFNESKKRKIYERKQKSNQYKQKNLNENNHNEDNRRKVNDVDKMFSLINQYSDLVFIMGLVQELITVYDNGYIFRFQLDFQSGQQEQDQIYIQNNDMIKASKSKLKSKRFIQCEDRYQYSGYEIKKLEDCKSFQERAQLQKQIKFQNSDFFLNNFELIKQLRPYLRKLNDQDKKLFISLKQNLLEVKDLIQHYEKTNIKSNQHICRICGLDFQNGRQLGGHMSRKHPGKSYEYGIKRDSHKTKEVQRIRREYFKAQQKGRIVKDEVQVKIQCED